MTTVACTRDVMAADSMAASSEGAATVTKLRKLRVGPLAGSLVGMTGDLAAGVKAIQWLEEKHRTASFKDVSLLLVRPNGSIWCYDGSEIPYSVSGSLCAIGTGAMAALGAFYQQKRSRLPLSPADAVRCAIRADAGSGGRVRVIHL